jgi:hypothetical protein
VIHINRFPDRAVLRLDQLIKLQNRMSMAENLLNGSVEIGSVRIYRPAPPRDLAALVHNWWAIFFRAVCDVSALGIIE